MTIDLDSGKRPRAVLVRRVGRHFVDGIVLVVDAPGFVGVRVPVEPVVERLLTPSGLIAAICDGGALTVTNRADSYPRRIMRNTNLHGACRCEDILCWSH